MFPYQVYAAGHEFNALPEACREQINPGQNPGIAYVSFEQFVQLSEVAIEFVVSAQCEAANQAGFESGVSQCGSFS